MLQTKFNLEIDFNKTITWFYLILFLTSLNAFYNFVCSSYGLNYPYNTFLFTPDDLHADLIKVALSYLKKNSVNYQSWSLLHQNYLLHNPYGSSDALINGGLTNFHVTPLVTNIAIINAKLIQVFNPNIPLLLFYTISIVSIYIMTLFFVNNKKEFVLVLCVILLSYPILFMLTRGHIYSLITNVATIFFIYHVFKRSNILIPIILLALMFNMRPNSLFLGLLFFIYGFKSGIKGLIFAGILSIFLFFLNLVLANQIYGDYTFENFIKALKIYYDIYVLGSAGNAFNNSMLSLAKLPLLALFKIMHYDKMVAYDIVGIFNTMIFIFGSLLGLYSLFLFIKNKINDYEFIFLITLLYVLVSSVFATYYMPIFFVFFLIPIKIREVENSKFFLLIMIVSVLMLSPKNYIFINGISLEVVINPLIMLGAIGYIIYKTYQIKIV
jgi:hypothetical protein